MDTFWLLLGWIGIYAPTAIGAIGSIVGCARAGQAACGAMLDVESGYGRLVGLSALPSSQMIYGIVVMFTLNRAVSLENAPGFVVVSADKPLFEDMDRRLWEGCGILAIGTLVVLVTAVHGSVHWGLRRPLQKVSKQLRLMKRGPWSAPAASLGSREIVELSNELESVGHTLDRRISMWVEAERRATYEVVRLDLRNQIRPAVRRINLLVGDILARQELDPAGVKKARLLLRAVEDIVRIASTGSEADLSDQPASQGPSKEAPNA